jgi:hypothetical protein
VTADGHESRHAVGRPKIEFYSVLGHESFAPTMASPADHERGIKSMRELLPESKLSISLVFIVYWL